MLVGQQQVGIVVGLPEQLGRPTDVRRRLRAARRVIALLKQIDDIAHISEVVRQLRAQA